ncbi:MAG: DUF2589 domain-containing protein [Methanomicrobiaceae archaeon]|uniref:Uncharacterized protein n=1 Tax=hydrocarbon metagenome TaxID=938273 RepID=A0A0W8FFX0_9ZZZZ|nr:DUF2589 domain-containing protein [Methanomicrobiaceae archaeon]MDD5420330.1 hypothetical protein [Methanomicrobiaceae archaeon]
MEVWESLVAAGCLFAVIGSPVCPCAGVTPAPAASPSIDQASPFDGLPMKDLIGGPLAALIRAMEQLAKRVNPAMIQFLMTADLEEFADGPLQMSRELHQTINVRI